jgi:hypothetical protein
MSMALIVFTSKQRSIASCSRCQQTLVTNVFLEGLSGEFQLTGCALPVLGTARQVGQDAVGRRTRQEAKQVEQHVRGCQSPAVWEPERWRGRMKWGRAGGRGHSSLFIGGAGAGWRGWAIWLLALPLLLLLYRGREGVEATDEGRVLGWRGLNSCSGMREGAMPVVEVAATVPLLVSSGRHRLQVHEWAEHVSTRCMFACGPHCMGPVRSYTVLCGTARLGSASAAGTPVDTSGVHDEAFRRSFVTTARRLARPWVTDEWCNSNLSVRLRRHRCSGISLTLLKRMPAHRERLESMSKSFVQLATDSGRRWRRSWPVIKSTQKSPCPYSR